jgi:hypothetical protein
LHPVVHRLIFLAMQAPPSFRTVNIVNDAELFSRTGSQCLEHFVVADYVNARYGCTNPCTTPQEVTRGSHWRRTDARLRSRRHYADAGGESSLRRMPVLCKIVPNLCASRFARGRASYSPSQPAQRERFIVLKPSSTSSFDSVSDDKVVVDVKRRGRLRTRRWIG